MMLIKNKKAFFDYTIVQQFQAGLMLTGGEVKSLRQKSGSLTGSYVKVIGEALYLVNAQITPYKAADNRDYDPKRSRKLLVKKRELLQLMTQTEQKNTVMVPLSIDLVGKFLKLSVGLGRGKKQSEKRSELRRRAIERDVQNEFKEKVRLH